MNTLLLQAASGDRCIGFKGSHAADWLAANGLVTPTVPNTWARASDEPFEPEILMARLGAAELFLCEPSGGQRIERLWSAARANPLGVYLILREDLQFCVSGSGATDVLAQMCNIDFTCYPAANRQIVLTLMVGVAVLIVPQVIDGEAIFRIWCDPSFGHYLGESLAAVVADSGGVYQGVKS